MEFNFGQTGAANAPANSNDPSNIASERLRKAIERNRKKQEMRQKMEAGGEDVPFQENWTPPRSSRPAAPVPSTLPTRQRVARPDDIDFTETPRRSTKRVGEIVEYAPSSRSSGTKRAAAQGRYRPHMIKAAWALVAIFALRLVFVNRGVMEYHGRLSILDGKVRELAQLQQENVALGREIELIKGDGNTQRKLVRDHLGFIAEDEYLVLFPREGKGQSI